MIVLDNAGFAWVGNCSRGWQFGEQGVLLALAAAIMPGERGLCVECGAGDGGSLPLTIEPFLHQQWRGVLIESDPAKCESLRAKAKENEWDCEILNRAWMPGEAEPDGADILVIDVDSVDYHIWSGCSGGPRIVMVEHRDGCDPDCPKGPDVPPIDACGTETENEDPKRRFKIQANGDALAALASEKGYVRIGFTRVNSIFVRKDCIDAVLNPLGGKKVVAVISKGRITFSDTEHCVQSQLPHLGIEVIPYSGVACWERGLTWAMERAIEKDADLILTLDGDSTFSAIEVVGMVSVMNRHPELAAAYPVQMNRHRIEIQCLDKKLDYSGEVTIKPFGHFGLTAIRTSVLDELPHPWFWAMPDKDGRWDNTNTSDTDITFWRAMHQDGHKVAQANRVVIGHIELHAMYPTRKGVARQPIPNFNKSGPPVDVAFWPKTFGVVGPSA